MKSRRGQVLAEFAVASLAALALMLGIIDCGRAIYTDDLITQDALIGMRYAIVNGASACASSTSLQTYVSNQSYGTTPSLLTVATACPGGNTGCTSTASPYNGTGCTISVNVSYTFHFIFPLISILAIPMSAQSQMTISQ